MSRFETAIIRVLTCEVSPEYGPYCDTPGDPGGPTSYGITVPFLSEMADRPMTADDVRGLSIETAIRMYRKAWDQSLYSAIGSQIVATKTFDFRVNAGPHSAFDLLQNSCNDCGQKCDVDGQLGTKTIASVNACDRHRLVSAMCSRQEKFYRALAARNTEMAKFLYEPGGWLDRSQWRG